MNARRLVPVCAALLFLACRSEKAVSPQPVRQSAITITPALPTDIPGGAPNADLTTAARFAWQQFIALNWPADRGGAVRGKPDEQSLFAANPGVPLVWETFRSKVEIYPPGGTAATPPHGFAQGAPDYGWNDPPQYPYVEAVGPCAGASQASVSPAWINLDEVSQVGFDHMRAGSAPGNTDDEKLIRFTAKANEDHYRYIASNQYWYKTDPNDAKPAPYNTVTANFTKAVASGEFVPGTPYVLFPDQTMEAKAAFRRLNPRERQSGRYHLAWVRFYETNAVGKPCYREEQWGLLALHIIQKTPSAPAYTWATFEQADNLRTEADAPIEDENGKIIVPGLPAFTPPMAYQDGIYKDNPAAPCVSIAGKTTPPCVADPASAPFCKDPAARLYFDEILNDASGNSVNDRIPVGGNICATGRAHPIPDPVIAVNREAHDAIADYEKQHQLQPSPWRYYKLVNVQAFPFDKSEIGADPVKGATFYTSNMVVETDYSLQHHSGGPEPKTGGAPSDLPANFPAQPAPKGTPAATTYQNTYILNADGSFRKRYNMGGCTGCHGEAQILAGTDYSYIMVLPAATLPDTAGNGKATTLRYRYLGLLNNRRQ
jgi:hypothetical protein